MRRLTIFLPALLAAWHAAGADDGIVHHPDVRVSLFAKEPLVVDPVAIAFAANGDLFVVEMRDYPHGFGPKREPGGTVRLLRDTDADGQADEAHLFAEGLSFPTSVTPWRGGILVAAPPQILFLEDTDGDDRADVRRVIAEGFVLGVTDGKVSGLQWGVDNRIHGTKGASPAFVSSPLNDDPTLRLGNYDFAIDPDTGRCERTSESSAGFGLTFDPFGHSFSNYNIDYLQQRILPLRYRTGSPWLPDRDTTVSISAHGADARIYPVSEPQTRLNHPEQAGRFSSASGMACLADGIFSKRLGNSLLVCDVVCNLVHRNVLEENGPIFRGRRAPEEQTGEFLASRDNAFRPVSLAHGPDGALYLTDMQRDVIEHPDYIPANALAGLDIRAGDGRGRIYRIVPAAGLPALPRDLHKATPAELAAAMDSPSSWHLETAQRLLVERQERSAADALPVDAAAPQVRTRALWTLEGIGALATENLRHALADPDASVRENAVLLTERHPELAGAIPAMLDDAHPRVRFQAALTLAFLGKSDAARLLARLTADGNDPWMRYACLCASGGIAPALLRDLPESAASPELLRDLAETAAAQGGDLALGERRPNPDILTGLARGWKRRAPADPAALAPALTVWCDSADSAALITPLLEIHRLLGLKVPDSLDASIAKATAAAADIRQPDDVRAAAIRLLGKLPRRTSQETLLAILSASETAAVQRQALEALKELARPETGSAVVRRWDTLSPFARPDAIRLLLSRETWQLALLEGLETGKLRLAELNLDLEQRRTLLRWSSAAVKKRARPLISDEEYQTRKDSAIAWLGRLPAEYDAVRGRVVFEALCSTCHRVGGTGHAVGPDLGSVSHRSVEDILTHIVDPNMAIHPKYATCLTQTKDGRQIVGILAQEDASTVTLLMPAGIRETVARQDIESFRTLQTSLMPEGLDAAMTPQQMRDLIAFLQGR